MMPNSSPYKVGITGGIGSGKSVMTKYLIRKGYKVIDADQIAREVVEPGKKGLSSIVESFGSDLLTESGTLNREKLGRLIFDDQEARFRLNAILHPLIKDEIASQIQALGTDGLVFVDVPLLFETNSQAQYDETVLVYATEDICLERIVKRDEISHELAYKKINAQIAIDDKVKLATYVIDNSKSLDAFYRAVDLYLSALESRQINNER